MITKINEFIKINESGKKISRKKAIKDLEGAELTFSTKKIDKFTNTELVNAYSKRFGKEIEILKENLEENIFDKEEDLYHDIDWNDVNLKYNKWLDKNLNTNKGGYLNAFEFIKSEIKKYKMTN